MSHTNGLLIIDGLPPSRQREKITQGPCGPWPNVQYLSFADASLSAESVGARLGLALSTLRSTCESIEIIAASFGAYVMLHTDQSFDKVERLHLISPFINLADVKQISSLPKYLGSELGLKLDLDDFMRLDDDLPNINNIDKLPINTKVFFGQSDRQIDIPKMRKTFSKFNPVMIPGGHLGLSFVLTQEWQKHG